MKSRDKTIGEIEPLRAEYFDVGFLFELTGPAPAYHFVSTAAKTDPLRSRK